MSKEKRPKDGVIIVVFKGENAMRDFIEFKTEYDTDELVPGFALIQLFESEFLMHNFALNSYAYSRDTDKMMATLIYGPSELMN